MKSSVAAFAAGCGAVLATARYRSHRHPHRRSLHPHSAMRGEDPNLWLENVDSEEALHWVRSQNAQNAFKGQGGLSDRLKDVFDSNDKIPFLRKINEFYYNFWKDEKHERGVWRRTTLEEYRKDDPRWEVVIDLDELSEKEGEKWVWKQVSVVPTRDDAELADRGLVQLSPGGTDACEVREFDIIKGEFLDLEREPFFLPAAKSNVTYKDVDTLLVGTDFGHGSLTNSGYPRIVKEWKRGTPLSEAKTIFEGNADDVSVSSYTSYQRNGVFYHLTIQSTTFYTSKKFVHCIRGLGPEDIEFEGQRSHQVPVPDVCSLSVYQDQAIIKLRSEWKGFTAGSLIAANALDLLLARSEDEISDKMFVQLFSPSPRTALLGYTQLRDYFIVESMDNIKSRADLWSYKPGGRWSHEEPEPNTPFSEAQISSVEIWSPPTYTIADVSGQGGGFYEILRREKDRFDTSGLEMRQFEAVSLDGTKIPYFQVGQKDNNETSPTLLYGYGGFEVSLRPGYQIVSGISWLEKGYNFVYANIRGGGEFGPTWHQAALKRNRNKAYEDFEAIARDLIDRKVTTPYQLGTMGGSNGGLLMGNMLTRSPELFGAIVCMVPLLDMKRYSKLLAGASWMAEYGDPDTSDWEEFLHDFSPYHNLSTTSKYPPILFTTSTRDDRVHPGHARKMAKKMIDMNIDNVFYWENIEGGHGGSSTNAQRAQMWAIAYEFLESHLSQS